MKTDPAFETEAQTLLQDRLAALRRLTTDDVAALPETSGEERIIGGYNCTCTTSHQRLTANRHLVTIQVARPAVLGLARSHAELGLVFEEGDDPRGATEEELVDTGG